jgi:hypothetical protein
VKLLKDTFPNITGRLIVQDLHQMKREDIAEVEFQAPDLYQEQSVKGRACGHHISDNYMS